MYIYIYKLFQIGNFELSSIFNSIMKQRISILQINEKGVIMKSWHSINGEIFGISDIEVVDNKLFLGSPYNNFLGVLNIPHGFL